MWIRIGFNADPDPAFYLNADPDPAFYLNADPDTDPDTDPGSQTMRVQADPDPDQTFKSSYSYS